MYYFIGPVNRFRFFFFLNICKLEVTFISGISISKRCHKSTYPSEMRSTIDKQDKEEILEKTIHEMSTWMTSTEEIHGCTNIAYMKYFIGSVNIIIRDYFDGVKNVILFVGNLQRQCISIIFSLFSQQ